MVNFTFDPNRYKERGFAPIPAGDYRVRIDDVEEMTFSSGNEGYKLTLAVSGYSSKIWVYLTINPNEPEQTNQRLGDFFNAFGITEYSLGTGKQWIGCAGAARIKHEIYNSETRAKIAYFISRKRQGNLPPFIDVSNKDTTSEWETSSYNPDDLPW